MIFFQVFLVVYLGVGFWLSGRGVIFTDALSRVANASDVVSSRQPHLAAIGFVWNPLPSLFELPFTLLKPEFPGWVATNGPAIIMSAVFMAGSAGILVGWLRDLGVRPQVRRALGLAFALHPYILLYGSNGMSEGMQIFFLLLAGRSLSRWLMDAESTSSLPKAGFALAGGYMARYEVLAAGAASIALVGIVSWVRGAPTNRLYRTAIDITTVGAPFIACFAAWAITARLIVKSWFPTLDSEYGNTHQVGTGTSSIKKSIGTNTFAIAHYLFSQTEVLEPLAIVAIGLTVVKAVRQRKPAVLAALSSVGAVLAFDSLATLSGHTFGWLRFNITVIPLTILCAGFIDSGGRRERSRYVTQKSGFWAAVVSLAVCVPAFVTTPKGLVNGHLAREEVGIIKYIETGRQNSASVSELGSVQFDREIAARLDAMHLANGQVLVDQANAFEIILASRHPKQFVIDSDLDYERALSDPTVFKVRYLLISNATASFDAVVQRFPGLWLDGGGVSTLAADLPSHGHGPSWRLFRLNNDVPSIG